MWGPFFYPHTVKVRDVVAGGGMGVKHGGERTLPAEVRDEQQLVLTADGSEVVSSSQVTVAISEAIEPGALVTVWPDGPGTRTATVLAVDRHENDPPLDAFLVLSLR